MQPSLNAVIRLPPAVRLCPALSVKTAPATSAKSEAAEPSEENFTPLVEAKLSASLLPAESVTLIALAVITVTGLSVARLTVESELSDLPPLTTSVNFTPALTVILPSASTVTVYSSRV